MGAYLGLRDSWFWEDDAILDAIETLQDQADGTFYPAEYGPEGHTDIACPNLWGYLIPQEESEPFERLFAAREDEQVAKLYGTRFAYARWYNGADGEPKVGFLPAPVSREEPLACVLSSSRRQNRRYDFDTFGVSRADLFFYSRDLPSISAFSILLLAPPNSTSLPWCMMRSMMAEASLSSPNTTPHLLNSIFVVITRLRFS